MEVILPRAWVCPLFLVVLLFSPIASGVDPIDFLESLKDDEEPHPRDSTSTEYPNGVNVIPGEPDVNYPTYDKVPKSSFSCIGRPPGFYADTELRCQVWHICDEDRRQQSFLCTNGTVYSQDKRVCDWWYNVNCDPSEVSRNYIQNLDLYKGPPPKSDDDQAQNNENDEKRNNNNNNNNKNFNNNNNDFDYQPTTKSYNNDPFSSQFPSARQSQQKPRYNQNNQNNDQRNPEPTPSYNEPSSSRGDTTYSNSNNNNNNGFPSSSRRQPSQQSQAPQRPTTTSTTTYRPPTTYNTPAPPEALQSSAFPPRSPQNQQRSHSQQQSQQRPQQQSQQRPQQQSQQRPQQQSQQRPQQQSQQQPTPAPSRATPSIKTTNANGKRIVEIRVPVSQIPPEILAKYGKRIPEHLLKEIFLNFTRNQQKELQNEAISNAKPNNPTGAGPNTRASPPSAPIPQNRQSNNSPPPPPQSSKKPVNYNGNNNNNKQSSFNGNSNSNSAPPPPPPPPPPAEPQQKFRHSTPRKVDNVKFATPTRELLDQYDDERQQVGESQNPIYSLQQLFSTQHSRTSSKAKAPPANSVPRVKDSFNYDSPANAGPRVKDSFNYDPSANENRRVKDSFNYEATPTAATQAPPQQFQEFTRSQPRRRIHTTTTTAATTTNRVTTEEPELVTDRYFPVATKEEKKQADIRRIFLVAKQGIKVLPPIPVLSAAAAIEVPTARRQPPSIPVTHRPQFRTTPVHEFSKIPPPPKVAIPNDYYVQNERFEEAESRYPRPSAPPSFSEPQFQQRQYSRPTTSIPSTTTTTTTTPSPPPPPPTPRFPDQDFRRTKPNKQSQNNKKKVTPPPQEKSQDDDNDYDSNQERVNQDELELLRLAQQYIELTGQDFGVKTPRNA